MALITSTTDCSVSVYITDAKPPKIKSTVKHVLRGHRWDNEMWSLRQVTSYKRFNSNEIFYDRTRNIESNTEGSTRWGNLRHPRVRFQSFSYEACRVRERLKSYPRP